jgi:hypothetical protein
MNTPPTVSPREWETARAGKEEARRGAYLVVLWRSYHSPFVFGLRGCTLI